MKYILLSLTSLLLFSCQSEEERQERIKDKQSKMLDSTSTYYYKQFKIYTLDSCQYVVVGIGNSRWGSHKGDCTNPIHQSKDTIK
jgi:uncharacterized protein YcfL